MRGTFTILSSMADEVCDTAVATPLAAAARVSTTDDQMEITEVQNSESNA